MQFCCSLCFHEESNIVATKEEIRFSCFESEKAFHRCSRCDTVQLFPQWTKEELNKLYFEYSQKKDFSGQKNKKKIYKYIQKYLNKDDKILEIGCGRGDTVKFLCKQGYDVIGIDKDKSVCDGFNVFEGDIFSLKEEKFDFVYAMHLFEHVESPELFLFKLKKILNDNGRFLFEVPNVNDPLIKFWRNKAYQEFYWYPFHLFCYDNKTIKNVLKKYFNTQVELKQRYGIINHLWWRVKNKPTNLNFEVPVLDKFYKKMLIKHFNISDTLVVFGTKK